MSLDSFSAPTMCFLGQYVAAHFFKSKINVIDAKIHNVIEAFGHSKSFPHCVYQSVCGKGVRHTDTYVGMSPSYVLIPMAEVTSNAKSLM